MARHYDNKIWTESERKAIGERINNLMNQFEYENVDLAKEFNIPEGTISRWRRGINVPGVKYLAFLADKLETTVSYIIGINVMIGKTLLLKEKDEHIDLIKKTIEILKSGTHWSGALSNNINSFHIGFQKDQSESKGTQSPFQAPTATPTTGDDPSLNSSAKKEKPKSKKSRR